MPFCAVLWPFLKIPMKNLNKAKLPSHHFRVKMHSFSQPFVKLIVQSTTCSNWPYPITSGYLSWSLWITSPHAKHLKGMIQKSFYLCKLLTSRSSMRGEFSSWWRLDSQPLSYPLWVNLPWFSAQSCLNSLSFKTSFFCKLTSTAAICSISKTFSMHYEWRKYIGRFGVQKKAVSILGSNSITPWELAGHCQWVLSVSFQKRVTVMHTNLSIPQTYKSSKNTIQPRNDTSGICSDDSLSLKQIFQTAIHIFVFTHW